MTSTWPFKEAMKIVKKIEHSSQKEVVFSTGFGPSGLPHIGTFGEIKRTEMVIKAFKHVINDSTVKCILKVVSDDMDGLRKVPDNIPNKKLIESNLEKPLIDIPDPFEKYNSFAEYMNNKLIDFINRFIGIEFEFISASNFYRTGKYNESLKIALKKYDKVLSIMLPSLGDERKNNYSPFLPICKNTGKVLQAKVIGYDINNNTIDYLDEREEKQTNSIMNGECKLQWKPDWGMRWSELKVDYEMHGKDLTPSAVLSSKICNVLGGSIPVLYQYELFLDNEGKKISKSKGNGFAMDDWLRYSIPDSLSLYMYQNPHRAKKLSLDIVPKITDEYLTHLSKYKDNLDNPIWYIYSNSKDIPVYVCDGDLTINYSLLLNLAKACNPENTDVLWGLINQYGCNEKEKFMLNKIITSIVNYYNDFIKNSKKYFSPDQNQKKILQVLLNCIESLDDYSVDNIQNNIYRIGRDNGYDKSNMRDLFKDLYSILLGTDNGPRLGSFFYLYGKENSIKLISKFI